MSYARSLDQIVLPRATADTQTDSSFDWAMLSVNEPCGQYFANHPHTQPTARPQALLSFLNRLIGVDLFIPFQCSYIPNKPNNFILYTDTVWINFTVD